MDSVTNAEVLTSTTITNGNSKPASPASVRNPAPQTMNFILYDCPDVTATKEKRKSIAGNRNINQIVKMALRMVCPTTAAAIVPDSRNKPQPMLTMYRFRPGTTAQPTR
ncbi:hypothetical protein SDC9_161845 [bioreactor metagenome]|uniref:Uncharacterized protein n=1 Tax=bioreactor metagenome TaxID=1076179 RepID=A0A645FJD5_9ZZZZ